MFSKIFNMKHFFLILICLLIKHGNALASVKELVNMGLKEIARTRILTPQLTLKQFKTSDAPELFRLTDKNRSHLKQWLPWLDYCTQEKDSLAFIDKSNEDIDHNKALVLGMFSSDKLMGTISFHEIDWPNKQAGIGYWIGKEFEGKGFITTACKEIIDIGFNEIKLDKILLSCATGNDRSRAVAQRLGFTQQEIIPNKENLYGNYVDHVIYSLKSFEIKK